MQLYNIRLAFMFMRCLLPSIQELLLEVGLYSVIRSGALQDVGMG